MKTPDLINFFEESNDKKTSDKIRISLYVNKQTYEDFKKACGSTPASNMVEALMQHTVREHQAFKKKSKNKTSAKKSPSLKNKTA